MKWIEWNPVPFGSSSGDFLPSSYSFGLSLLTLLLFLPLGLLGYFSPDLSLSIQLIPLFKPFYFWYASWWGGSFVDLGNDQGK